MAKDLNWPVILLVVAVGYVLIFGMPMGTTDEDTGGDTGICGVEDVSFTPKMTRLGKAGTTIATSGDNYYILTDNLGSQSAAAATTVPTNYEMEIMFAENSASTPTDSTPYYTKVETVSTACADPAYHSVQLALADTSISPFYCENSDGTVNAITNNESMDAGDVFETTCYFKAGADSYFGNPDSSCENIAVVEYDKTYVSKIEGTTASPYGTAFFTYNGSSYDGQGSLVIPKSADGALVSFSLEVTADASTAPDGTNPPIVNIFDCDIDKDEDTLELIHSVADEDNNLISLTNASKILWID